MIAVTTSEDPWLVEESEFPVTGSMEGKLRFLVRYALLAPSVHNTQPWAFAVKDDTVRLLADETRCLRAADRDMRDLYVSLGCALENLCIAAEHFGFHPDVRYLPVPENPMLAANVTIKPEGGSSPAESFGLFDAITARRTNHSNFNEEQIPEHVLHRLTACCVDEDVRVYMTTDEHRRERFARLLLHADILRFSDRQYVGELEYWVRQEAYDTPWLVKKLHELACYCRSGVDLPNPSFFKGAPVLGVICTTANDRLRQIRAGRVFERMFLRATTLGLSLEPMTYVLQVAATRADVAGIVSEECGNPQVAFRLGNSTAEPPHTPRRKLEEVLAPTPNGISAVVSAR